MKWDDTIKTEGSLAWDVGQTLNPKACPTSPGTHIVGPWVTDSIQVYKVLRTGAQYVGNWASRDS